MNMTKELLKKFLMNDDCTKQEFEHLLFWLKNEASAPSGKSMVEEIWDEFEPGPSSEKQKYSKILDKIHHRINLHRNTKLSGKENTVSRNKFVTITTRVAAVLFWPVLFLLIYTSVTFQRKYAENNMKDLEVTAPMSSRTCIELGDGTKVWLNNGSKLKYPYRFNKKSRKVILKGEAYFDVVSNKDVPFVVEADKIEVIATGTEFNVMAYPDDHFIETTLVEGKVILQKKENNEEIKSLNPNESLKFYPATNIYSMGLNDIEKNTSWRDGLLVFKNDPIDYVAQKLSRWYNVEVAFTAEVRKYTYTAKFADETLSQVLELLELATPVHYELTPREKLSDGSFSRQKILIKLKE
jgi:transmembrane sensor